MSTRCTLTFGDGYTLWCDYAEPDRTTADGARVFAFKGEPLVRSGRAIFSRISP